MSIMAATTAPRAAVCKRSAVHTNLGNLHRKLLVLQDLSKRLRKPAGNAAPPLSTIGIGRFGFGVIHADDPLRLVGEVPFKWNASSFRSRIWVARSPVMEAALVSI